MRVSLASCVRGCPVELLLRSGDGRLALTLARRKAARLLRLARSQGRRVTRESGEAPRGSRTWDLGARRLRLEVSR